MVDPRHGPQVRPAPTSWARVRLLKGDSAGGLWDVSSDIPEARIAIGTDPQCGWVVKGSGVAPFHFEIYWDGQVLWAGNSAGAPDVRVDGEPLGDWRPISGRARIEFGRAAMLVEASDAVARASVVPQARDSQVPIANEQTRIAAPRDERREVYATGGSALHRMPPPDVLEAGGAGGGGEATRVLSLAEAEASRPAPAALPRVGVGAGVRRVEEPTPISEEATRLGVFPSGGQASALPPGARAAADGAPGAGSPRPAAPSPASVVVPAAGGLRGPVAGAESPFAAPPPIAPDASEVAFARVGEKLKGGLAKPQLSQPLRTWLLLSLVVAIFVVFVLDTFEAPPEERPAAPGAPTTVVDAGPAVDAGPPATPPLAAAVSVGAGGLVMGGVLPPGGGVPVPPPSTVGEASAPLTAERIAADAVIAGRYREALPLYRALAAANPQNPTFARIVQVLERRVRAACRNGLTPEGTQCAP
jgi:hypothetical protein